MRSVTNAPALLALLAVGGIALGTAAPVRAQVPIAPSSGGVKTERHPNLRRAIQNLERIKDNLQRDPKDFDGHKAKAIGLIDQARQELELAIQSDKT